MLTTETLYTPYNGAVLLENPLLNKGLAFTQGERTAFNLQGLLPHNVETIEEQTVIVISIQNKLIWLPNVEEMNGILAFHDTTAS